jgi:hypothetical protein
MVEQDTTQGSTTGWCSSNARRDRPIFAAMCRSSYRRDAELCAAHSFFLFDRSEVFDKGPPTYEQGRKAGYMLYRATDGGKTFYPLVIEPRWFLVAAISSGPREWITKLLRYSHYAHERGGPLPDPARYPVALGFADYPAPDAPASPLV